MLVSGRVRRGTLNINVLRLQSPQSDSSSMKFDKYALELKESEFCFEKLLVKQKMTVTNPILSTEF